MSITKKLTQAQVVEIRLALEDGVEKQQDIAKRFEVSRALINAIARGRRYQEAPAPAKRSSGAGNAPQTPPEEPAPAFDPEIDQLVAAGNVEWLRRVRDNAKAPWSERTKCAIALARLEREEQLAGAVWQPPEGVAWAEALAAAISEQPAEVRARVVQLLSASTEG